MDFAWEVGAEVADIGVLDPPGDEIVCGRVGFLSNPLSGVPPATEWEELALDSPLPTLSTASTDGNLETINWLMRALEASNCGQLGLIESPAFGCVSVDEMVRWQCEVLAKTPIEKPAYAEALGRLRELRLACEQKGSRWKLPNHDFPSED